MATHLHHHGCAGTSGDDCCTLPAEFVRMRYYFGQRLGVVDLFDEQRYHAGKQRFHNLRGHGHGVLCGLTAERFAAPGGGPPTTVLRVNRGAALDPCGREIVVGADQCVDIAAWFQKHRARLGWEAGDHTLTVGLCYRDCPSDPGPAPRDACGCDAAGCEFGRVREGFELKLLTDEEAEHVFHEIFPKREDLGEALAAADVREAIDALVGAPCPQLPENACLSLASLIVSVGDTPLRVTTVGEPDNTIPSRESLLSTAALQELLLRLAARPSGDPGGEMGPSFGDLSLDLDGSYVTLEVPVLLAPDGVPFAESTLQPSFVELRQFVGGWEAPVDIQVKYLFGAIRIHWDPVEEGNYRLTIAAPLQAPIVDTHMRPFTPAPYVRQFSLTGNPLVLSKPRF